MSRAGPLPGRGPVASVDSTWRQKPQQALYILCAATVSYICVVCALLFQQGIVLLWFCVVSGEIVLTVRRNFADALTSKRRVFYKTVLNIW